MKEVFQVVDENKNHFVVFTSHIMALSTPSEGGGCTIHLSSGMGIITKFSHKEITGAIGISDEKATPI